MPKAAVRGTEIRAVSSVRYIAESASGSVTAAK
jgi:hypothetical protein